MVCYGPLRTRASCATVYDMTLEGNIFRSDNKFHKGRVSFENGIISDLTDGPVKSTDLIIPGLIDIHCHGNSGFDFTESFVVNSREDTGTDFREIESPPFPEAASLDSAANSARPFPEAAGIAEYALAGLKRMAEYQSKNGVTAFAAASVTAPYEMLKRSYDNALHFKKIQELPGHSFNEARLVGINMEGPFLSYGKRGAQDSDYLKSPDLCEFMKLYDSCEGLIKIVDIAPELDGAVEFIKEACRLCTVSLAHSECSYENAAHAFASGASQVTHIFNGMNGIHHRSPGIIPAAAERENIYAEIICDGIHVHPSVVRAAFKLFPGRIILISDSLSCTGLADGSYHLGSQDIILKDHRAVLKNGTLAGSAADLFTMLKNAVAFHIPIEDAIAAATANPARQLGLQGKIGSISPGLCADLLVLDQNLNLKNVYINGMLQQ